MDNLEKWQHWVHKIQDEDKKAKKTTQKIKKMSNTDTPPPQTKPGSNSWLSSSKHYLTLIAC